MVIFAFVGIQLSWNMRPFLGNKQMEFQLFRAETQGNFYQTVFSSVGELLGINNKNEKSATDNEEESGKKGNEPEELPILNDLQTDDQ